MKIVDYILFITRSGSSSFSNVSSPSSKQSIQQETTSETLDSTQNTLLKNRKHIPPKNRNLQLSKLLTNILTYASSLETYVKNTFILFSKFIYGSPPPDQLVKFTLLIILSVRLAMKFPLSIMVVFAFSVFNRHHWIS